jgi:ABC-2 type transport system permease protein
VSGRVRVIVLKEWAELVHRKGLMLTMTLLPALFLVTAFAIALLLPVMMGAKVYEDPDLESAFRLFRSGLPGAAELDAKALFQVFMLRQFLLLLLLVPVFCAMSVAAYGIVGEKVNRSLEPLLATPITTAELLMGKTLAAVLPGIGLSWAVFAIYAVGIALGTAPTVARQVLNMTAVCIVFLLCPLVAVLGLSVVLVVSSRSSDPRTAQQIGAVVIVPLLAIVVAQFAGFFMVTPLMVVAGAVFLAIINYVVLRIAVPLFQRETILTRWK